MEGTGQSRVRDFSIQQPSDLCVCERVACAVVRGRSVSTVYAVSEGVKCSLTVWGLLPSVLVLVSLSCRSRYLVIES